MKKIKQTIKQWIRTIQYIYLDTFYPDAIKLFWHRSMNNFGDILNPVLIHELTGKQVVWVNSKSYPKENYLVIGSILESASTQTIVWGSGFISEDSHCHDTPRRICAVRGPLTRDKLLQDGIECPEVYGDPALLLPTIYNPKIEKKYELGIIPHFIDKDNIWLTKMENHPTVKILNIQDPDLYHFIDELLSCEKIASSSLHGIITSDAYSIPSLWIEFSDKVTGQGFKFLDYFASVKRQDNQPLYINENTELSHIYENFHSYNIDINLNLLIKASPFSLQEDITIK